MSFKCVENQKNINSQQSSISRLPLAPVRRHSHANIASFRHVHAIRNDRLSRPFTPVALVDGPHGHVVRLAPADRIDLRKLSATRRMATRAVVSLLTTTVGHNCAGLSTCGGCGRGVSSCYGFADDADAAILVSEVRWFEARFHVCVQWVRVDTCGYTSDHSSFSGYHQENLPPLFAAISRQLRHLTVSFDCGKSNSHRFFMAALCEAIEVERFEFRNRQLVEEQLALWIRVRDSGPCMLDWIQAGGVGAHKMFTVNHMLVDTCPISAPASSTWIIRHPRGTGPRAWDPQLPHTNTQLESNQAYMVGILEEYRSMETDRAGQHRVPRARLWICCENFVRCIT